MIGRGDSAVQDGVLAAWQNMPQDGDYCLKLTALDKVGNRTEERVNVTVDTTPPAAPLLFGESIHKTDVRLSWTANEEPDCTGYMVYRNSQRVNENLIEGQIYTDAGLREGVYTYTVKAADLAGWESEPSNEIRIRIDLSPPDARISSPRDGARVCKVVDIRGIASGSGDFRQYRVSVGKGEAPEALLGILTALVEKG